MNLALFPAPGGGLKTLKQSGQLARLIDYYLPAYARAFDEVFYFSYLNEALSDYGANAFDPQVHLVPNATSQYYRIYAFTLSTRQARWLQTCSVSRVFQAPGVVPAWRAKRRWGIPLVTTYGYRYAEFARAEHRWVAWVYTMILEQLALRVADAIIVTTDELADYVKRYATRSRIHLIPNGVDTRLFSPAPRPAANDPPVALFVGRLEAQKNLEALIDALALLRPELEVRLVLIGEGSLREKLPRRAMQAGVNVEFVGTVPHEQLPNHLREADFFVLPSLIEGHPKALLEAMSVGLPCVGTDVPGTRDLIRDGKTGIICPGTDPAALATGLRRCLQDPATAQACGVRARSWVEEHFSLPTLLAGEVDLLQRVAAMRKV